MASMLMTNIGTTLSSLFPNNTVRVEATLYYQTASKEYVDFLRTNGGVDEATLGQLWDTSKSPPEVMATAFYPSIPSYVPVIHKSASTP
jgi:hypothetical protein